jgi:hypothetical protein
MQHAALCMHLAWAGTPTHRLTTLRSQGRRGHAKQAAPMSPSHAAGRPTLVRMRSATVSEADESSDAGDAARAPCLGAKSLSPAPASPLSRLSSRLSPPSSPPIASSGLAACPRRRVTSASPDTLPGSIASSVLSDSPLADLSAEDELTDTILSATLKPPTGRRRAAVPTASPAFSPPLPPAAGSVAHGRLLAAALGAEEEDLVTSPAAPARLRSRRNLQPRSTRARRAL